MEQQLIFTSALGGGGVITSCMRLFLWTCLGSALQFRCGRDFAFLMGEVGGQQGGGGGSPT